MQGLNVNKDVRTMVDLKASQSLGTKAYIWSYWPLDLISKTFKKHIFYLTILHFLILIKIIKYYKILCE